MSCCRRGVSARESPVTAAGVADRDSSSRTDRRSRSRDPVAYSAYAAERTELIAGDLRAWPSSARADRACEPRSESHRGPASRCARIAWHRGSGLLVGGQRPFVRQLRRGAKREAAFLAVRTERRQAMRVKGRAEIDVLHDGPVVREGGRARPDSPANP